jgi:anthraniloyl-CoA monooxygenase
MHIVCVGGGPGGLYFATLMKRANPRHQITVLERNRSDHMLGFGVVFSDAAMVDIAQADAPTYALIARELVHWDDIEVRHAGTVTTSAGHGFSGLSRNALLRALERQARDIGADIRFGHDIGDESDIIRCVGTVPDLVVAADGATSLMRSRHADCLCTHIDTRANRFVWLGTSRPFASFTFAFRRTEHGFWRAHAYQYAPGASTFIVECREDTWRRAGMDAASESDTVAFLERVFEEELQGHHLSTNRSIWRQFSTVRVNPWSVGNFVLLGDAAHTAHFSVGSGTRMAMEDAIALRDALTSCPDIPSALAEYEAVRRPRVESLQRAALASLDWFEHAERYAELDPVLFTFSLLTRSLRLTHEDLQQRDPEFLARVDATVVAAANAQVRLKTDRSPLTPPMFTPFRLRDLVLTNRIVVSPMCQYVADDGTVGDWHLVHLGSRAIGGAGLVMAEMTDVSREARISTGCAGLYKDEHIAAWKRIVDFVHRETPAAIGIQLGHAGRKGATKRLWEGDSEPLPEGGWPLISPSPIPYFRDRSPIPREMSRADMDLTVDEFVHATERAAAAGFDLLEIHMAHGYLLASFISPLTNQRRDDYGGSLTNRLRFPLEVFHACRITWPSQKPMSVRISAVDWTPGGMEPDDAVEVARLLKSSGCDIVDVSAGQTVPDQQPAYGRLFQTPFADRIRYEVGICTMAVGNISSYADANTIIAAGRADLCLLARAHLFDPYWTRHAAVMQGYELPWPDSYRSVERYMPRLGFRF